MIIMIKGRDYVCYLFSDFVHSLFILKSSCLYFFLSIFLVIVATFPIHRQWINHRKPLSQCFDSLWWFFKSTQVYHRSSFCCVQSRTAPSLAIGIQSPLPVERLGSSGILTSWFPIHQSSPRSTHNKDQNKRSTCETELKQTVRWRTCIWVMVFSQRALPSNS